MNTLRMGKRGRKKTIIEKRITNTFDDKAGDIIEDSNSAFPREIKIFKTPLKGLAPRDPSDPVFIAAQRALVSDANKDQDEELFRSEASKMPKFEKVKYYTSLILGTLCIVNVFVFLFLIPFVLDPAISTISQRYIF